MATVRRPDDVAAIDASMAAAGVGTMSLDEGLARARARIRLVAARGRQRRSTDDAGRAEDD